MDRNALLWTLVVFFGASIMFRAIRNATDDESIGVTLGLEVLAGLVVIGAIVLIVRRRG
jgi:hypothetical protein